MSWVKTLISFDLLNMRQSFFNRKKKKKKQTRDRERGERERKREINYEKAKYAANKLTVH